ncbi:TPA: restriction endonuclease [Candidatus Avigastranaerophilus faecigallinarum]|nr:restriction endonuclease [Candidatus Avigastranaerophilus faecigallinarum]
MNNPVFIINNFTKKLLKGIPKINPQTQYLEIYSPNNQLIEIIPFSKLNHGLWGFVYERLVGLYYEDLGYEVDYIGLEKNFKDLGIDLICKKNSDCLCIQCKCVHKNIGKQSLENILYKASRFFEKNKFDVKPTFLIVVPNIKKTFTLKLQNYVKSLNYTQNYTYLKIEELNLLNI